jgi:hypothetical protein
VAAALACALASACTDGTTPDCDDAQCAIVGVGAAGEGGDDVTEPAEGGDAAETGSSAPDADAGGSIGDAGVDAEGDAPRPDASEDKGDAGVDASDAAKDAAERG